MGLPALVYFVLKCIKLLTWPAFALGYPLCASVQAIETNSNDHMRNMVTYWILFSLICLFEHVFVGLLQWLPVWPIAKILVIFWLVIPRFNGASIAYDSLIRVCLSVQLLRLVLGLLNKNHYVSFDGEAFPVVGKRYVDKHGTEDLEELVSIKPKITEHAFSQDATKTVESLNESEADAENKLKDIELTFAEDDGKAVEILNESGAPAENKTTTKLSAYATVKDMALPLPLEENVQRDWTCAVCQVTTNSEATLNSHLQGKKHKIKCEELNFFFQPTTKLNAYAEVKHVTLPSPLEENAQREWTCAVCQVTTNSEVTLKSHLQGRKHMIKCEELNFFSQTTKKLNTYAKIKGMTLPSPLEENVQREWTCAVCQVTTNSEVTLNSHLQGKKHWTKCEELEEEKQTAEKGLTVGGSNRVRYCTICQVITQSEATWISHLQGQKHKSKELQAIVKAAKKNIFPSITTKSYQANHYQYKASSDGGPINKFSCANTDLKRTSYVGGPNNRFGCDICQVILQSEATLKSHVQGRKHKLQQQASSR